MSLSTLFETQVKIGISDDGFQKGIAAAGQLVKDFASVGGEAISKLGQAVSGMVKDSVQEFAAYEQNYGGLVTMFEDLAWDVEQNANKAFKTAGLSVNEYMETAMSFSASLNQSLERTDGNIRRSADLTDLAVTDMADNVAKMGSTMESVQNAYKGFSRGNYMMLDNLKLGYGGTKQEMERLLEDAQKLSGVEYNIENFSDMIEAIHVIQENMGITGTAANEASETISGSTAAMSAAWKNLKLELSKDEGDIETAIENFQESAETVIENIEPRIEKALIGFSELAVKAAPKIAETFGRIAPKIAPSLVKAASSTLTAVVKGAIENLPEMLSTSKDILTEVGGEIGSMVLGFLPDFLSEDIRHIFGSISDFVGNIDFGKLKDSLGGLGDSLEPLIEKLSGGVAWAFDNVVKPFGEWLMNDALPVAIDALSGAFTAIDSALEILAPVGKAVWEEFLSPLFSAVGDLAVGSLTLLGNGLKAIGETFKDFDTVGFIDDTLQGNFWDNWKAGITDIGNSLELFGEDIDEFFKGPGEAWNKFWQTVGSVIFDVKEKVVGALDAIAGAITKVGDAIKSYPGFFEGFGEYVYDKLHDEDVPEFANGGRVTRPTYALVGEKEPETIIPDSKLGMLGGVTININVEGGISSDYDVERIANKLADLNIFQTRAIGGTGF